MADLEGDLLHPVKSVKVGGSCRIPPGIVRGCLHPVDVHFAAALCAALDYAPDGDDGAIQPAATARCVAVAGFGPAGEIGKVQHGVGCGSV